MVLSLTELVATAVVSAGEVVSGGDVDGSSLAELAAAVL